MSCLVFKKVMLFCYRLYLEPLYFSRRGKKTNTNNGPQGNARQHSAQRRPRLFPIGYEKLLQLSQEDATSILFKIVTESSGFPNLLNATNVKPGTLELAVAVMVKACTCRSSPGYVIKLLNSLRASTFLSQIVTSYITRMSASNINTSCIRDLLTLFRELLDRLPTSSRQAVLPPFATLQLVVASIRERILVSPDSPLLIEEIDCVCSDMNTMKELMDQQEREATKKKDENLTDDATPAEDFRAMSVFPTLEDIHFHGDVFLRKNKVQGVYRDLDHYLDVQFRLLREDFMQPLRAGIQEYLAAKDDVGRRKRFQNIRVYTNVQIIEPVLSRGGIAFRIHIDVSRMAKVKWAISKRLIYGSMVCLSKDDFQTVLFATVQDRDVTKLAKGELELRVLGDDALPETSPADAYLMVETSAYFEAYVHVLNGLQKVQEDEFAFQRYIVRCEAETRPPAYMNGGKQLRYDLSCLVDKGTPHGASRAAKSIPVLQLELWPTTEALGLDASQLRAVQAALTREFAVIQGPPGTGKTYIGLKVVQTLLENRHVWSGVRVRDQLRPPPILIVCFTNHALDQFLVGIHTFHQHGIVRVGGRSQSEIIQSFSMEKQRQRLHRDRELPRQFGEMRHDALTDMDLYRGHIEDGAIRINTTYTNLIRVEVLEPFMRIEHFEELQGINMVTWLQSEVQQMQDFGDPVDAVEGTDSDDEEIDIEDEAMRDESLRKPDEEDEEDKRAKTRRDAELRRRQINERVKLELVEEVTDDVNTGEPEWETQTHEKKKHRQRARQLMRQTDEMTQEEMWRVVDMLSLPLQQRWRLYRYWVAEYRRVLRQELSVNARLYQNAADRLKEVNGQTDLHIMKGATVLGMTTSGAARNRALLQELQAKIIVVEEAAEVLESHIVTTLNGNCQHLILIGDHQQLRPKPNVFQLAREYNLNISLFERMFNNGVPCETLECQHRMRPEISLLLRHIYPDLRDDPSVHDYGNVKGVSTNMFFIQHANKEQHDDEVKSHRNEHEAAFTAKLCRYLLMQGHATETITVLTTYSGQLFELRKQMPKKDFDGVRVCVVDNYQGEENDIVLLSLVRSNDDSKMGFLTEDNRVCVALSRARVGFYVIGNFRMFVGKSKLWAKLVKSLNSTGAIGEKLGLYCQNHPDSEKLQVSIAADFDAAPEGGCLRPCEARLSCGHVCAQVCHVYDKDHTKYKCKKPCTKVLCDLGHVCRRMCHEKCDKCVELINKIIPDCGHSQKVPCHMDPDVFICQAPCEHVLECGHDCANVCGKAHTIVCCRQILHRFPCGHSAKVQCCNRSRCPQPCGATLACGHPCGGRCSDCHQGRLHVPCPKRCDRTLVCGHACPEPCSATCPPCRKPCKNRCTHSRCMRVCGAQCQPCMEPCPWICKHHECRKLCHEQCDRPRCRHGCKKRLKCGHTCIGVCGEPCPDKCRVCAYKEVCEVFFGTEDEPDAKFVQLEDCGHVLEVTALDNWMDQSQDTRDGAVDIQLRRCPKCKTPIQRSLRYGAIVNKTLSDIESVKSRIIGDKKQRETTKERVWAALTDRLAHIPEYSKNVNETFARLQDPALGIEEAVCLENITNLLSVVSDLEETAGDLRDESLNDQISGLKQWALMPRRRLGEQEQADMIHETRRLSLAVIAVQLRRQIAASAISLSWKSRFDAIAARLNSGQLLSDNDLENADSTLKEVRTKVGAIGTLTDAERLQVVKAMGLSQGHWFKCPRGTYDVSFFFFIVLLVNDHLQLAAYVVVVEVREPMKRIPSIPPV